MASNFLLSLSLSLLLTAAFGQTMPPQQPPSREQHCRIQHLSATQPWKMIESEGSTTELWDEKQNHFQCAGVVPMRNTLRPNGLSLPSYHPTPRLIYIERGQGIIGATFPGCPETYHTQKPWESKQNDTVRELHQKVHRVRKGDVVAIPAGVAHWCYNDGNEELVAVSINDLNHLSNQLDRNFRTFYLAGGLPRSGQQEQTGLQFQNIFQAFDTNLLAEAFNVAPEIVRQMQTVEEKRGLSFIARDPMSFIRPVEEEEEGSQPADNGLEETFCTMNIRANLDEGADVYSAQAGKVNVIDRNKLPILKHMDMSAEKGNLLPNTSLSLNWAVLGHTVVYVTRGGAQIQVVDHNGQSVMKDGANRGSMFVLPQYYTFTARAGNAGLQWVALVTTGWPLHNSVAGYTSVFRATPLRVLTNAYQISPDQAQGLKINSGRPNF